MLTFSGLEDEDGSALMPDLTPLKGGTRSRLCLDIFSESARGGEENEVRQERQLA